MSKTLPSGMVTGPNLISRIGELTLQDFDDLTDCSHIATRSADLVHNRFANSQYWLDEYVRTLMFLGWSLHEGALTTRRRFDVSGSVADFLVRKAQALGDSPQANARIDTLDAWRLAVAAGAGAPAGPVVETVLAALADDLDAPRAAAAIEEWAVAPRAGATDDPDAGTTIRALADAALGLRL